MTPELLFRLANPFAMAGWLVLIASIVANRPWLRDKLAGTYWPIVLSAGYLAALIIGSASAEGTFSTLTGVRQLFSNDWFLLAGWIHYLAFDLFIGAWIAGETERSGVSRWFLIPILPLTFMFGPVGLLLFFIVKAAFAKPVRS